MAKDRYGFCGSVRIKERLSQGEMSEIIIRIRFSHLAILFNYVVSHRVLS
jgi:hypothetical protein